MRRALVALVLAAGTVAGCRAVFPIGPSEVRSEASDGLFRLEVVAAEALVAEGVPFEVFAEVSYLGPKPRETLYHAISPMSWRIERADGIPVFEPSTPQPCRSTELDAGHAQRFDFPAIRGWSDGSAVVPAPGSWRFIGRMRGSLGDCGAEEHALEARVEVTVTP